MSQDPKTLAIDSSELLERQHVAAPGTGQVPKTIAIDSEEIARRQRERAAPASAGPSRGWILVAAVVAGLILAYTLTP